MWTQFSVFKYCYVLLTIQLNTSLGGSYLSAEMQSVYSAAPAGWATGHLLGRVFPSAEMQSVYSAAPADWATGHLLGRVLPLCRDAVGVFCSPGRLGHRTLVGEGFSLLQRCSRCILQPQPIGPLDTCWGGSYPSAEMQSVYLQPQSTGVFICHII